MMPIAGSAANLLVNGGLEDGAPGPDLYVFDSGRFSNTPITGNPIPFLPGWTEVVRKSGSNYTTGSQGLMTNGDPAEYGLADTPYGNQYGFFADAYQTVTGLTPGQTYRLSGWGIVNLAVELDDPMLADGSGYASFSLSLFDSGFAGLIDAAAPPTPVAESGLHSVFTWDRDLERLVVTGDPLSPSWRYVQTEFTAPADGIVSVAVFKYSELGAVCNWDHIVLEAIPEPSAILLLGAAALPLLRRRRLH